MDTMGFVFGISGYSFGMLGFIFGIAATNSASSALGKVERLEERLIEADVLEADVAME